MAVSQSSAYRQSNATYRVSRSWRSLWLHFLVCALIAASGVVVSLSVPESILIQKVDFLDTIFELRLPLMLLIMGVAIIRPLFLLFDTYHVITPHHVRSTIGICSWERHSVEIAFEDILDVEVYQTIIGRIIGYGDIRMGAADTSVREIQMPGIYRPERLVGTISHRIDRARLERRLSPVTSGIRRLGQKFDAMAKQH